VDEADDLRCSCPRKRETPTQVVGFSYSSEASMKEIELTRYGERRALDG